MQTNENQWKSMKINEKPMKNLTTSESSHVCHASSRRPHAVSRGTMNNRARDVDSNPVREVSQATDKWSQKSQHSENHGKS